MTKDTIIEKVIFALSFIAIMFVIALYVTGSEWKNF